MGASLGALAMLHAHRLHPELASTGSSCSRAASSGASSTATSAASRASSGSRASSAIMRRTPSGRGPSRAMTCGIGRGEPGQQPRHARALARQGYPAELVVTRDAHNWDAWRDVLDPHLTRLLARLGMPAATSRSGRRRLAYGHWGRPLLAFPSSRAPAGTTRTRDGRRDRPAPRGGTREALLRLQLRRIAGRPSVPARGARAAARRLRALDPRAVAPLIHDDCGRAAEMIVTGASFGAYHAANFALKRADLFPVAICQSGVYDVSVVGWGERGDGVYFNNRSTTSPPRRRPPRLAAQPVSPPARVRPGPVGGHDRRARVTNRFAGAPRGQGHPYELDLWGHDVPHDWPSWRASWRIICRGSAVTPTSTSSGCCSAPRRTGRARSRRSPGRVGPFE